MAALIPTNGVLTISNSTDTFTAPGDSVGKPFSPRAASFTASAAGHVILQDADGVTMLELYAAATSSKEIDNHFFANLRPFKTPIKCSVFTGGGKLRLYV
jgi:hypothetical protein